MDRNCARALPRIAKRTVSCPFRPGLEINILNLCLGAPMFRYGSDGRDGIAPIQPKKSRPFGSSWTRQGPGGGRLADFEALSMMAWIRCVRLMESAAERIALSSRSSPPKTGPEMHRNLICNRRRSRLGKTNSIIKSITYLSYCVLCELATIAITSYKGST